MEGSTRMREVSANLWREIADGECGISQCDMPACLVPANSGRGRKLQSFVEVV